MIDIIIDLETLGTRPGCPIIEIGACAIDGKKGEIVANFSRRVCCAYKFWEVRMLAETDAECTGMEKTTAGWWCTDDGRRETLRKILGGKIPLCVALIELADWIEDVRRPHLLSRPGVPASRVWANGPAFDISILSEAYAEARIPRPWLCYDERCVRTALEQANYERGSLGWIERGPRHRALNDARHEARKLYYSGALGEVSAIIKRLHQRGVIKGEVR